MIKRILNHYIMKQFLLLFYFCVLQIEAFNPLSTIITPARGATHSAVTCCSVATVTSEYFTTRLGVNVVAPTVTNGICSSLIYSQIQTAFGQALSRTKSTFSRWQNTLDEIVNHNELVDLFEQTDASRHFDSESFIDGSDVILHRYKLAINALNQSAFDEANQYFGQMTHTLQDFYSHSSWIEMNNRQPQPDLGINVMTSSQFAAQKARTCVSCSTGSDAVCQGNLDVSKGLTSGYFSLGIDIFNRKPTGKCSHGGLLDATRDNDAIGGINKDTVNSIHGYLHEPAAQTAYLATCKILRQLWTEVGDVTFGKFLNILRRQTPSRRISLDQLLLGKNGYSVMLNTITLNQLRSTESFTRRAQFISVPPIDSYYKAHLLSMARRKHVTIDVFRSVPLQKYAFDLNQDLARLTGGVEALFSNDQQRSLSEQTELIQFFFSQQSFNQLTIQIDLTCSQLLLELLTNQTVSMLTIQVGKGQRSISPSLILIDTGFYKAFRFDNLPVGTWKVRLTTSSSITFDLRVSCSSDFRCFSRFYVDNGNEVHTGEAELQGNPIKNTNVLLISDCETNQVDMRSMSVSLIDAMNGNLLQNSMQSFYDAENNRWITNLTRIPEQLFRLKYSINDGQIQRLSRSAYQPSLVDVEILQTKTTLTGKILVRYRVINYHSQSIPLKLIAKNIGLFLMIKDYKLAANEIHNDQIEFDPSTKASDVTGDTLALTVQSNIGDWNYDVVLL